MMIDLKDVDLNLLVTLQALLTENNVTRTAVKLGKTQPTISAQLVKLREVFSDPLLIPADNGRGMVQTERAKQLAPELELTLRDLQSLIGRIRPFDPAFSQRDFVLCGSDYVSAMIVEPLANIFSKAGAGIRVAFVNYDQTRVSMQLESGEVDLVLTIDDLLPSHLKARKLLVERFVGVQRKGHPRGNGVMTIDEYCTQHLHVMGSVQGGLFSGMVDQRLAQLGQQRQVRMSVQSLAMVPYAVAHSDFLGAIPSRIALQYSDTLDQFELPFDIATFDLYAGWHTRMHSEPAHQWLRQTLIDIVTA